MNIICNKDLLLKAVTLVSQVIPNKAASRPILANIRFFVSEEGMLELTGTDLEIGMRYNIPLVSCIDPGCVLIPSYELVSFLKGAEEENVCIELEGKTAHIRSQNSRYAYKLPTFSDEDYAEVPLLEGEELVLDKLVMQRLINNVAFAMNRDRNRYSLNSVLICFTGKTMETVATDQIRLAYSKAESGREVGEEELYVLPAKSISALNAIFSDDDDATIKMVKGRNQVTFYFRNGMFITRLVEAQFPKYRTAYDNYRDFPSITLESEKVLKAINSIIPLTTEDARNVALILGEGSIALKARTPRGEGEREIMQGYEGEAMAIGVNPSMIQDFLKEIVSQGFATVNMKVVSPVKPVIFSTDDNYLYFMSPVAI